jgi:subtilisin family serine protease
VLDAPRSRAKISLAVATGALPDVQTVIYVHGIGNKPVASVLKCQWDTALFKVAMGDRTRMAYWVNRERHPEPEEATCAAGDLVEVRDGRGTRAAAAAAPDEPPVPLTETIAALATRREERARLTGIAERMLAEGEVAAAPAREEEIRAKILPLPPFLRRLIVRQLTEIFLADVNDFLFNEARRRAMEESFIDRLRAGGGPFIVIAHSQGSMIAYDVLRRLGKDECDVRLLLTIGSPLGIQEVQDELARWAPDRTLRFPACVARWVNVADRLDPVAIDAQLDGEFRGGRIEDVPCVNPDSPFHPHSATGYLSTAQVRGPVRDTAGIAFSQITGRTILVKDLVEDLEDGRRLARHRTLIQLSTPDSSAAAGASLDETRRAVTAEIEALVAGHGGAAADAEIDPLRRFVAASLTRLEIESLRTRFKDLRIERVWRDAAKRALIRQSTSTIQARPASVGYGATGEGITWAVLDTGIRADHPHFEPFATVVGQWDCTRPGAPIEHAPGSREFNTLDGNGHGTHVAGIVAGCGRVPLDRDGEPPVEFSGMAPRAKLVGFKVLADDGEGRDSWIIKALDRIAEINESAGRLVIQGVNLSLGGNFDPSVYGCGHTPLCQELRRLWNQGVLVCLAAGNEGYAILQAQEGEVAANLDLSIGDPANLEEAIAVGSIHKANPHTYGVSFFSSRGPTADGRRKPDLVAPGERILSASHAWKRTRQPTARDLYIEMSGTSMATPHVSGLLAAFLSVRREFVGYPDRVKEILLANCTDLRRDVYIQGVGMPNLIKMLSNT